MSLETILADFTTLNRNPDITCAKCDLSAVVTSKAIGGPDFRWCPKCFATVVVERTLYEQAADWDPEQVTELTGVIHSLYHLLDEGRIDAALTLIEQIAQRFPECSSMPLTTERVAPDPTEPKEGA